MRLNRSRPMLTGASQGFQTPPEGESHSGSCRSAKCSNCRARSGRPVPVPPTGFCESQESRSLEGSPPAREKLLNLHRMKDLRRGLGDVHTSGRKAQPSKLSASTPRRAIHRRQAEVAKPADLSRKPEILKLAPIGHFVRFSRRAGKPDQNLS